MIPVLTGQWLEVIVCGGAFVMAVFYLQWLCSINHGGDLVTEGLILQGELRLMLPVPQLSQEYLKSISLQVWSLRHLCGAK